MIKVFRGTSEPEHDEGGGGGRRSGTNHWGEERRNRFSPKNASLRGGNRTAHIQRTDRGKYNMTRFPLQGTSFLNPTPPHYPDIFFVNPTPALSLYFLHEPHLRTSLASYFHNELQLIVKINPPLVAHTQKASN